MWFIIAWLCDEHCFCPDIISLYLSFYQSFCSFTQRSINGYFTFHNWLHFHLKFIYLIFILFIFIHVFVNFFVRCDTRLQFISNYFTINFRWIFTFCIFIEFLHCYCFQVYNSHKYTLFNGLNTKHCLQTFCLLLDYLMNSDKWVVFTYTFQELTKRCSLLFLVITNILFVIQAFILSEVIMLLTFLQSNQNYKLGEIANISYFFVL